MDRARSSNALAWWFARGVLLVLLTVSVVVLVGFVLDQTGDEASLGFLVGFLFDDTHVLGLTKASLTGDGSRAFWNDLLL